MFLWSMMNYDTPVLFDATGGGSVFSRCPRRRSRIAICSSLLILLLLLLLLGQAALLPQLVQPTDHAVVVHPRLDEGARDQGVAEEEDMHHQIYCLRKWTESIFTRKKLTLPRKMSGISKKSVCCFIR